MTVVNLFRRTRNNTWSQWEVMFTQIWSKAKKGKPESFSSDSSISQPVISSDVWYCVSFCATI